MLTIPLTVQEKELLHQIMQNGPCFFVVSVTFPMDEFIFLLRLGLVHFSKEEGYFVTQVGKQFVDEQIKMGTWL